MLLLELSGATLLLLDEPTGQPGPGLGRGPRGRAWGRSRAPCIAVTHDRWFTRSFDRFIRFGGDGEVSETAEPVSG